jgi:hypothetical protein
MALIRRSLSNLTRIPGTTSLSVVSGGLNIKPTTSGPLEPFKVTVGAGGSFVDSNIQVTGGRTDFSTFTPTQAQKNVLTPQNVIGDSYITVERVTSDFQTGAVNVEYSVKAPTISKPKAQPMSNKRVNASNAATLSKYLGRTVTAGEQLSIADVQRINTPGAALPSTGPSRGFTGGQGWGQAFPIDPAAFALAQKAVAASRIKSLAIKSGFQVKTAKGVNKNVSFTKVSIIRPK